MSTIETKGAGQLNRSYTFNVTVDPDESFVPLVSRVVIYKIPDCHPVGWCHAIGPEDR